MFRQMQKQYAVISVITGYISIATISLQLDILNYQRKTTMKIFSVINVLNKELPFGVEDNHTLDQATTLGLKSSNLENHNVNISKNDRKLINLLGKIVMTNNDPNTKNSICKYYSIDDCCSKKFYIKQYFSILHLNIESL